MYLWSLESENESRSVASDSLRSMDYTVHGILQARILEWVAFPFSRGSNPGLLHCRWILYQLISGKQSDEAECSVYYSCQARSPGEQVLKSPNIPIGLQGKDFKDRVREGGWGVWDQLKDILLIGWWWGNWASASPAFWFQPIWNLRACGQHAVNIFHLVGVKCLQSSSKDMIQNIIYRP